MIDSVTPTKCMTSHKTASWRSSNKNKIDRFVGVVIVSSYLCMHGKKKNKDFDDNWTKYLDEHQR